ncbi:hypothetical protein HYS47_00740 [Candidatus Woesearchaeota archaeon]|nr:hypothetical protein [Candidatus Woesearchaeota archaeon]
MAGLEELTRRELLGGIAGLAALAALPTSAQAKPLEEITEHDFRQKVYENTKPVIVLFGEDKTDLKQDGSLAYSKRMQQVIEALADKYPQIDFLFFAYDHNTMTRQQFEHDFKLSNTSPMTVMYARHDVFTGKRFDRNVKIDVLRGGPKLDKDIPLLVKNLGGYWIPTNLFGQDNLERDGKVYRLENTFEDWKMYDPVVPLR